jgi:hypothetical protein
MILTTRSLDCVHMCLIELLMLLLLVIIRGSAAAAAASNSMLVVNMSAESQPLPAALLRLLAHLALG